jgi:NAD(P)-dependent dehydrogenase (short-subunit alcohol dehydrogenase family)
MTGPVGQEGAESASLPLAEPDERLTMRWSEAGRLSRPAMAADLRLQSATWMREFDASFVTGTSWLVDGGCTAR